jgi:hypothetical protein
VINEETIQKLLNMKLASMAQSLRELIAGPPETSLSFEEKVGMMIDREWSDRENRRLARRIKEARLGTRASLETSSAMPRVGSTSPPCASSAAASGCARTGTS